MIEDLKAFCIIYIVLFWVILVSVNSKSIQHWKQELITWNEISSTDISNLFNCCLRPFIILWLVCLYCSNKSLSFNNLSLFLHHVWIFWLKRLYIMLRLQKPALNVCVIWCKTSIYIWNLSEKNILDVWRFISSFTSLQFEVYHPLFYLK